jgi:hypothetical protein
LYIALFHKVKKFIHIPSLFAFFKPRREAVVEDAEVPNEQWHVAHALVAYVAVKRHHAELWGTELRASYWIMPPCMPLCDSNATDAVSFIDAQAVVPVRGHVVVAEQE